MVEILVVVGELAAVLFVICQMLAMGLVLTVPQIIEPLKNTRLVILALVANFILVPLVALALVRILPMSPGYSIGLILVGCAAGAPFLPKLSQIAKGDIARVAGDVARERVHVGDHHEHDVQGARRAGMKAVWFNRYGRAWEGEEPPDAQFGSFEELPALVEKLEGGSGDGGR